jgi:hypothetical protein
VHDSPGLEIGDGPLNDIANFIDLLVEFFLPVEEIAVGGLPDGRSPERPLLWPGP